MGKRTFHCVFLAALFFGLCSRTHAQYYDQIPRGDDLTKDIEETRRASGLQKLNGYLKKATSTTLYKDGESLQTKIDVKLVGQLLEMRANPCLLESDYNNSDHEDALIRVIRRSPFLKEPTALLALLLRGLENLKEKEKIECYSRALITASTGITFYKDVK
jgi:hypothetical protein